MTDLTTRPRAVANRAFLVGVALSTAGCDSSVLVGSWACGSSPGPQGLKLDAGRYEPVTDPVAASWSTGFEDGFCGYTRALGYCYRAENAHYTVVTEPTHSGQRAAAFEIDTDAAAADQTRCVREGEFPTHAYYGAWFYLPASARNNGNWNLMHFQGGEDRAPDRTLLPLWDVSIASDDDDRLTLFVRDFVNGGTSPSSVEVPIGAWFQLEFRWLRSTAADGAVALYQDGRLVADLPGIETDISNFAQWYVGNLADNLAPAASTLYVDDVTIRPGP